MGVRIEKKLGKWEQEAAPKVYKKRGIIVVLLLSYVLYSADIFPMSGGHFPNECLLFSPEA